VQEKKFADRLQETLRKYNNRAIETAQSNTISNLPINSSGPSKLLGYLNGDLLKNVIAQFPYCAFVVG
jgi:hypothetical protein